MKTKYTALSVAALLLTQNIAMAGALNSPIDDLKSGQISPEALAALVDKADSQQIAEMRQNLAKITGMIDALKAIQERNDQDPVLKWANKLQVILVGSSALLLNSHVKNADASKYKLQLAAASAILNSFIRHYAELHNLQPQDLGKFLTTFNQEMSDAKIMTPEVLELSSGIANISNQLMQEKSMLDDVITRLGGGSDIATGALVLLSIAHWLNPKLANEAEVVLEKTRDGLVASGANLAKSGRVVVGTGATAGAPDLIGITLGMDSKKAQDIIASTLNNLQIAKNKLQLALVQKAGN